MSRFRTGLTMLYAAAWLSITQWLALLLQIAGVVGAMLAFYLLLNIPDSHAWTVAISGAAWPAFIIAALWIQVLVFRLIRGPEKYPPLKLAVPILLLWLAIWFFLWHWVSHYAENLSQYASYLNSRLSAQGRAMLTYQRIYGLLDDAYIFVQWWLLPVLLLPAAIETCAGSLNIGTARRVAGVWFAWPLWLVLILSRWIGGIYTHRLIAWHPQRSWTAELVGVFGRTALLVLLDVLLWYFIVSVVAVYLRKAAEAASAGTPDNSQPLTAENP